MNITAQLVGRGTLERYGVELIGAGMEAIERAEDRGRFREVMAEAGLETPQAGYAKSMADARSIAARLGFPLMIRPSYILGGGGTGMAYDAGQFEEVARRGLDASPVREILVEESVEGWKEFELEVMRDHADNAVVICSIENLDAMGVHTGDSITVAPIQTLSDREYQQMRDDGIKVLRTIGVETGGSNVQFAVEPRSGRRRRPPAFPSPRSPPGWRWATPWMRSPTTSPARRPPPSNRRSTMWLSRSPGSTSPNFPPPVVGWDLPCKASEKPWRSAVPSPKPCRKPCEAWRPGGWGWAPIPFRN